MYVKKHLDASYFMYFMYIWVVIMSWLQYSKVRFNIDDKITHEFVTFITAKQMY